MKRLALAAALAAAAAAQPVRISRDSLQAIELGFDRSVNTVNINDPIDLIGTTRGVYIQGFGVVFTTEVNLVMFPISPFHPAPNKENIARLHTRKVQRLPVFRDLMRKMMVSAASALDNIPETEQVVMSAVLYYRSFEERDGLPEQIIMRAPRKVLKEIGAGRAAASAIQVEEF